MFELLKKYKNQGAFDFSVDDNLKAKCEENSVPDGCCGVYVVYACLVGKEVPVYIGSSGHMEDNEVVPRIGGLRRRIRGKQKDVCSCKSTLRGTLWPKLMREQSISKLKVSWYDTEKDNPLLVEYCLILEYIVGYKRLPDWNNELKLNGQLKGKLEEFIAENQIEILKMRD